MIMGMDSMIFRKKENINVEEEWMPFLVIAVGQECSLKCKNCANFAPYAPKEMMRYAFEDIQKSLQVIWKALGGIQKVQIQGGEPFLCQYLAELLQFLKKSERVREITVTTNGTIMPEKRIIHALKRTGTLVSLSNYQNLRGGVFDALISKFEKEKIAYQVYNFAKGMGTWIDMGGVKINRENNDEVVNHRFERCPYKWCMTLEKNMLGYCSRSTVAKYVQNFEEGKGDYLDLWDESDIKSRLIRYVHWYRGGHVMEACHYCNPDGPDIVPAQQIRIG